VAGIARRSDLALAQSADAIEKSAAPATEHDHDHGHEHHAADVKKADQVPSDKHDHGHEHGHDSDGWTEKSAGSTSARKGETPMETRVFQLKHAKSSDLARGINQFYKVEINAGSDSRNNLVVRGTPDQLKEIEVLVANLDVPKPPSSPTE